MTSSGSITKKNKFVYKLKFIFQINNQPELYNIFDEENHLKPDFEKTLFDTLHSWDFGWAILELIKHAKSNIDYDFFNVITVTSGHIPSLPENAKKPKPLFTYR